MSTTSPRRPRVILAVSLSLFALFLALSLLGYETSAAPKTAPSPATVPLLTPTPTPITLPYCWQVVPAPDSGQNWTAGSMAGVSAISSNDVWALAHYSDAQGSHNTAAHWNGTAWSIVPIPTQLPYSTLNDLVAISHNDVWVVGSYLNGSGTHTVALHWDGTSWTVVPTPSGFYTYDSLYAVDASAPNDIWAVGSSSDPKSETASGLVLHWDGTQWTALNIPPSGALETHFLSVSATSPNSVWVGGYTYSQGPEYQALIYWDGSSWTNAIPVDYGSIVGIGVISLTDVWASVASYGSPAVPHFIHSDGTHWNTVSSQNLQLGEIEPISSYDIWAVAQDALLHWNGTNWGRVDFPGASFSGLAAISSTDIWAVGYTRLPTDSRMLALHYNPSCIPTPIPSSTRTPTPSTPTATPTPLPPRCPSERFTDVCPGDPFYSYILPLADDGILSGYSTSPPCPSSQWIPCFRPNNPSSRGQITKVVSLAANFNEPVSGQTFEDVPPGATFYTYTERLAQRGIIGGYACGGPAEPCIPPENRPYFRTNREVTRGQLSKMVALAFDWTDPVTLQAFQDVPPGSTFYDYIGRLHNRDILNGYSCGGPTEPCVPPGNLPYFRPNANVTRGQTAKIVQLARTQPTPTPTSIVTSTSTATPADATPTSTPTNPDCQGIPPSQFMQISPGNCEPAGTQFFFTGSGFQPHELVGVYITDPDGNVIGAPFQLEADENGTTSPVSFNTQPTFPTGQWSVTMEGVNSHHRALGYFRLLQP